MSAPLRIAVLHYHLRRGGVSRVIEQACHSLDRAEFQMAALIGEAPPGDAPLPCALLPELAYDASADAPGALLAKLRAKAAQVLGGPPDIWHIHNHSLGKNTAMPRLASALAEAGERLLLQPHDFAEDSRPRNYRTMRTELGRAAFEKLYPHSPRLRYALLNRRDMNIMQAAGAPTDCLRYLPNAVPALQNRPAAGAPAGGAGELIIYPTRAIRRKNLGELLLWAALADEGRRFGVTLAPENPLEQPLYLRWRRLAEKLRLPVDFELGRSRSLSELFAASNAAISTSLAEGFGLAFLEPWIAGRPLVGRRLPEISSDFAECDIDLQHCYERLDMPLDWLDRKRLLEEWRRARSALLEAYGITAARDDLQRLADCAIRAGRVDFGALGEESQSFAISRLKDSAQARSEITAELDVKRACRRLDANRDRIKRHFSRTRYAARLGAIYRELMEAPRESPRYCDPARLLTGFLAPERFRMILAEQTT